MIYSLLIESINAYLPIKSDTDDYDTSLWLNILEAITKINKLLSISVKSNWIASDNPINCPNLKIATMICLRSHWL